MSDPAPNCVIAVFFDAASSSFSYHCESSTRGWEVSPDGSIYPPIRQRVVQFRVKADAAYRIAGFQISREPLGLPPSQRFPDLPTLQPSGELLVKPVAPLPYPPLDDTATFTELTFDLGDLAYFFRLAVVVGSSEPIWDDPKIHDDGSQ